MTSIDPAVKHQVEQYANRASAHLAAAKAAAKAGRDSAPETRLAAQMLHAATEKLAEAKGHGSAADAVSEALDYSRLFSIPDGGYTGRSGHAPAWGKTAPTGRQWAARTADLLRKASGQVGVKALTSGTIEVPAPLSGDPVPLPDSPRRITDLLVDRQPLATPAFSFLRMTARDNQAAPVPDRALKPTSTYTFENVEDRARVVAHLADPLSQRYFEDHRDLVRFLHLEMHNGVLSTLETQIIAGDGVRDNDEDIDNFTGILHTDGVVIVDSVGDPLRTLRRARTQMELLSEVPTAWVFHPSDLERVDLMRETGDESGGFLVGTGQLAESNVFGNLPRIASPAVPEGTVILGDWAQARLLVRSEITLDADRSGTNFKHNLVQLRAEGRYGIAVLRPQAFAVIDIAEADPDAPEDP